MTTGCSFKEEQELARLLAEYFSIHDCVEAGCDEIRQRRREVFSKWKYGRMRNLWEKCRGEEWPEE